MIIPIKCFTCGKILADKYKVKFFTNYNEMLEKLGDKIDIVAIITPDKEIVENPNPLHPAFIVFKNYELILKWNRSLRFALAVCSLKNRFKNEI